MNVLRKWKLNRQQMHNDISDSRLDRLRTEVFLKDLKLSMLENDLSFSNFFLDYYRQLHTDTERKLQISYARLEEETTELEQKFGKLLNSLPIRSNNLIIYGVSLVSVRPEYDSEWIIEGFNKSDVDAGEFKISITRGDGENYFSLFEKLKKVKDFSQLRSLNIKHLIWYD